MNRDRLTNAQARELLNKPKRKATAKWGVPVKLSESQQQAECESVRLDIKPLSVNGAWKGQRFKTDAYKAYENAVLFMLPKLTLPEPPFKLSLVFGFSNMASDLDNPCKCLIDILQKAYNFNDRHILELHIKKEVVKKGSEFIVFEILKAA